jgi:hypothetical protein
MAQARGNRATPLSPLISVRISPENINEAERPSGHPYATSNRAGELDWGTAMPTQRLSNLLAERIVHELPTPSHASVRDHVRTVLEQLRNPPEGANLQPESGLC